MTVLVKAGEVDLWMDDGRHLIGCPEGYGLVHDESGETLDRCSLFVGPIETTDEPVSELPTDASVYFGSDYEARKARIDVPDGKWNPLGQVRSIVYFRPGRYEGDWTHDFDPPVPLYEQGDWLLIKLPPNCKVNFRGIVYP